MATVLCTGGVGFIGSFVVRALLERGDAVHVLDDFSDAPYPTAQKEANARDLAATFPGFALTRGCVTDEPLVRRLVEGVDAVVHLAGLAGVRPSFEAPARYQRVNVEGTATVLDAALRAGCRRFVLASSSSVYGNSTPLPAREEAPAIVPESPYAASKRAAELVLASLGRRAPDARLVALRFFTVYGPRQRPEMAISSFLRKILAGEPVTVFGDGSMRRDFTHVADIARGVLAALDGATPGTTAVNLGSGAPVSLSDLVAAMERAAGVAAKVERAPVPLGDVDATFADVARAEALFGWRPTTRLDDGLATVVAWLRATRAAGT